MMNQSEKTHSQAYTMIYAIIASMITSMMNIRPRKVVPMSAKVVTKPKIYCKVCHAQLEINDPGCKRSDCKVKQGSFKLDTETGLYIPDEEYMKHKKKKDRQEAGTITILDPFEPADETLIISEWAEGSPDEPLNMNDFPWYDNVGVC